MTSAKINDWVIGQRDRLVWIEFDPYAHKIFAGAASDWHSSATVFVNGIGQALGVVKTDVLSIDLIAPYVGEVEFDGAKPAQAIEDMLQLEGPRKFTEQVIDALAHRFADQLDLVLKIPSPAQMYRLAGCGEPPSFDDLDDVGIGLSNLLREFSSKTVAGVLVSTSEMVSTDEAEALESVIGAAQHYAWRVALSLDSPTTLPAEFPAVDCDVFLLPNVAAEHFIDHDQSVVKIGGALSPRYWQDESIAVAGSACPVLYGKIPSDAHPELVVKRVAALRA
jgi:hypothetical protein